VSAVQNGHVRGLAPAVSEPDRPVGHGPCGSSGAKRDAVRNGHVPGLAPGMAGKDGR
jgi:hypothetical protein